MPLSHETKVKAAMQMGRTRLVPFVQLCDERYEPGAFHYSLAYQLEQAFAKTQKRSIITTPPQHGKSTLTSINFPAWMLGRDPKAKIVCASYSATLAERNSRAARSIVEDNDNYRHLFPGTKVSKAKRAVDIWETEAGGYYKAVGVGGSLTGFTADCMVIDDPFKDWQEACSAAARNKVWDWFLTVAMTRIHPGSVVIIVNTRWNTKDLVGMLLDPKRIEELKAIVGGQELYVEHKYRAISKGEDGDPLRREAGQALWPERYPVDYLEATRANLTPRHWAALYDQEPVPAGGNIINPAWFNLVMPDDVPTGLRWVRFWDLATSENTKNDCTASLSCAMDNNGVAWVRDGINGRWQWPEARSRIKATGFAEQGSTNRVGVEAVAGFKTAVANLREDWTVNSILEEIDATKDKISRTDQWTPLASQGKINIVAGSWTTEFLNQCEAFPDGDHDDYVDAMSGAFAMAKAGGGHAAAVPMRRDRGFSNSDRRVLV